MPPVTTWARHASSNNDEQGDDPFEYPQNQTLMHTLKGSIPSLIGSLLIAQLGHAQFQVSNSNTANGNYPTFANAITALTTAPQNGFQPLLTLGADITTSIEIPAHDWDSLFIRPVGQRHIAASINSTTSALVYFNGASNVVIDGIDPDHTAASRLIINNPSSGANANAIRFANGASGNTVRNCTVRGASTSVSTTTNPGAVIAFFTASATTGNNNNTIANCRIRNANATPDVFTSGTSLPARAIFSYPGSVAAANDLGRNNTGNRVLNNWIFNFFLADNISQGILLTLGNHAWTIQGNRFFQEEIRNFTATVDHRVIDVDLAGTTAPAGGHVIRANVLGFSDANGSGVYDLHPTPATLNSNIVRMIRFDAPNAGPRSRISNNVIDGIRHRSGASSSNVIQFILINSGQVDVDSNQVGNVVGGTASIVLTSESPSPGIHAILNVGGLDLRTRGNRIGGISVNRAGLSGIRNNGTGTWTCSGNEVGGTFGLRITAAQSTPSMVGLAAGGSVTANVEDNTIRNLRITGNSSNNNPNLRGVEITSSSTALHTVSGNLIENLIGEKPVASGNFVITIYGVYSTRPLRATDNTVRNLVAEGTSTGAMTSRVRGIWTAGTSTNLTALNNTVENFLVSFPNAAAVLQTQVEGIRAQGSNAQVEISGNRIHGLRMNGLSLPDTVGSAALAGIAMLAGSGATNATVANNVVTDLENSGAQNVAVQVAGIRIAGSGAHTISANVVHTIRASRGTGALAHGSIATGIWVAGGSTNTVVNNMVRLGVDANGTQEDQGYRARGFWVAVPALSPNVQVRLWHNSVYVGGSGTTTSAQSSHALLVENNTLRDFRNNILWNARDIATSGNGAHYAMEVTHALPSANLTSNYNCLRITGANGTRHLVRAATTNFSSLAAWQADTGQDLNSFSTDPNFADPVGDVDAVDLHVLLPSPIDAAGVLIPSVTVDLDGADRASLTPVDIGAYAVSGTVSVEDLGSNATDLGLRIWPNPASEMLFVGLTARQQRPLIALVHDATGREVMRWTLHEDALHGAAPLSLAGLRAGTYLLRLADEQGQALGIQRFVKL